MNLGISIKVACSKHGMERKELAERVGISKTNISMMANGRIGCKLATLELLAKEFDLKVSEFIALGE